MLINSSKLRTSVYSYSRNPLRGLSAETMDLQRLRFQVFFPDSPLAMCQQMLLSRKFCKIKKGKFSESAPLHFILNSLHIPNQGILFLSFTLQGSFISYNNNPFNNIPLVHFLLPTLFAETIENELKEAVSVSTCQSHFHFLHPTFFKLLPVAGLLLIN